MTRRQAMNIRRGYINRVNNEFERNIWTMRELYALVYNIVARNRITPQQAFPLSFDKRPEAKSMPLTEFAKILQANFKARTDGRAD
ncbi:hypothetical protein [Emticicia sp. C21]|uniref:hypothetical protein n=1 Tax=Emticicia sp. C21 TaxID=2302915 RepID=UPI0011C1870C|nr:hypothetical protein [Emticicia sp. C21]